MFTAPASNHLVPYDGSFRVHDVPTAPPVDDKKELRKRLKAGTVIPTGTERLMATSPESDLKQRYAA